MATVPGLAGVIAGLAIVVWAAGACAQQTQQLSLPNVTVTAPAVPVVPPYLRNPRKSYERNPYDGRYRVEEEKFAKAACTETRIAFGSGGTCLKGYRLASGCDMVLDVVSYAN